MRLSDGFLQAPVDLPETPAPSWVPPRWEPQSSSGWWWWSGRWQRLLSLTRTVVPSKGALALSCKEPSSHCTLAGLRSPFNLCPPPQPSPRSFQDWINKIHPRVARNTSCEGICCTYPCWPGSHPQTNSNSLAFSHLLTSLSQNIHYF